MKKIKNLDEACQFVLSLADGDLKLAAPLGLGKANQLLNLIYDNFKSKYKSRRLEIYTALSLDLPELKSDLEIKLLKPFLDRHFGTDYPRLQYVSDLIKKKVPKNIKIFEFYFRASQFLKVASAQENYISLNYTHAARALAERGLQVVVQLVAKSDKYPNRYSLSCNSDMTLDLVDLYHKKNKKIFIIGVVHPDLPFLAGDAEVGEEFFEAIVESPEVRHQLFALPRNPINSVDHLIGFHASQLIVDDGTLQIGIGTLSDALVYSTLQRQQKNSLYNKMVADFHQEKPRPTDLDSTLGVFQQGLYGTSEMLMDGFMHLRQAGVLKRMIFDLDENRKRFLHAAFFLGSKKLYEWLRNLSEEDYRGLGMTRVSKVNDLYDAHEMSLRRQRKNARFFNTCMEVNILGAACSDTLPSGQVVSGVGGQFNFVAMSQELSDSHSVLMLRSTRTKNGKRFSNIVTTLGQTTIPRHLRDIVITEYGIAFLHGKSDSEVIIALIEISDSEFQQRLIDWAKKNNKLSPDYELPAEYRQNNPARIHTFIKKYKSENVFSEAPFGLDFSENEFKLIKALSALKEKSKLQKLKILLFGLVESKNKYEAELKSLNLFNVKNMKDFLQRHVVKSALSSLD